MAKNKQQLTRGELIQLRDKALVEEFNKLTKVQFKDSEHVINDILQYKYFLCNSTIRLIIGGRYKRNYNNQVGGNK